MSLFTQGFNNGFINGMFNGMFNNFALPYVRNWQMPLLSPMFNMPIFQPMCMPMCTPIVNTSFMQLQSSVPQGINVSPMNMSISTMPLTLPTQQPLPVINFQTNTFGNRDIFIKNDKDSSNKKINTSNGSISSLDNNTYNSLILKHAKQYDVNPNLIKAIMKQESRFNPNATSPAGAQGLMQLMPATAKGLGVENSLNPDQNIEGGVKYISKMLKKFNNNIELALAAYNAGPSNVRNGQIPQNGETPKFVENVMKYYNQYENSV